MSVASLAASPRAEVSLNGTWQAAPADADLAKLPPTDGWREFTIPGTLAGRNRTATWFRRTFDVPADWRGQRVQLRFNGVKYNSTVFVNGQRVGGCFNGYDQFTLDITGAVKFGAANTLLVGARDWSGIFNHPMTSEPPEDWQAMRSWPKDDVLAPIGGRFESYGIWDDVTLLAVPPVRVADVTIIPSVRNHTLALNLELTNDSDVLARVTLKNAIAEAPEVVFQDQPLELAAGQRTNLTINIAWKNPKLWDFEHPNLYHLVSTLGDDTLRTRFGFREFWVEHGRFFLNGVPITLRATATWPVREREHDEIAAMYRKIKEANTIAFRTHTQPWRQIFYDVADEVGLLVIPEGAIWNDRESYRVDDERFWKNYRDHLAAMWRRLKNNPSIVMWSLENEFYGGRCTAGTRGEAEMAKAGQFLKQLDPTRPITYESDGDPGGVADVIGMHYPHEYPQFRLYPDTCYWLDHSRIHGFFWPTNTFQWDRTKPLYIGEFLWLPSNNPDWHTLWFGDDAYIHYNEYRNRGKGLAWRDQIVAYRTQGLNGIGPWTMFEGGPLGESNHLWQTHAYAYHPIGAYLREADTRFFSGERVERTVTLFNDTLRPTTVTLEWSVQLGGKQIAGKHLAFELKPDEHVTRTFAFTAPAVAQRTDAAIIIKSSAPDVAPFEDRHAIQFWPRTAIQLSDGVAVYGASKLPKLLAALPVLKSFDELTPRVRVLIVPPHVLDDVLDADATPVIGENNPRRDALLRWVRAGGRALVFTQNGDADHMLPLSFEPQTSTMTFAQNAQHPALRGIGADDLKFWRGDGKASDVLVEQPPAPEPKRKRRSRREGLVERAMGQHVVTSGEPAWDSRAGVRPIVVAGNARGLATAPLCEARRGEGVMLLCGLQLLEKFETEPVARVILQNCLEYLASYTGTTSTIVVNSDDKSRLLPLLSRTGARVTVGDTRASLANGAIVWLHRPSRETLAALHAELVSAHGPVRRADELPSIGAGLAREDFYWLGESRSFSYAQVPQARDSISTAVKAGGSFTLLAEPGALAVADVGKGKLIVDTFDENSDAARRNAGKLGRLFATLLANCGADFGEAGPATMIDASRFEPVGHIEWFGRESDALYIGCNGKITTTVQVAEAGDYTMTVVGRGTPAAGRFPILEITLDGKRLGEVELASASAAPHDLAVTLPAGRHELALAFINDFNQNGEDRNLWLHSIEFRKR